VSGEFIQVEEVVQDEDKKENAKWTLRIHSSTAPYPSLQVDPKPTSELNAVVSDAAISLAGSVEPYVVASYFYEHDRSRVMQFIDQCLKICNIKDASSTLNLRGLLKYDSGRYAEASDDFTRSLKLDPDFDIAWVNLGFIDYVHGDYRAALVKFQNA